MGRTLFIFIFLLMMSDRIRSQDTAAVDCNIYLEIPECPENPVEKPGYYRILDQIFQDPKDYWNVSKPYDDNGCVFNFMRNGDNVTFPGNAYLWNTNVPIEDCPYSMGEIKTMTVDTSNHSFKSYYFYGPGYVEAKIRQLYCSPGQGSAMWLWCVPDSDDPSIIHPYILDDNEIDVFETQPDDSNSFNIAYHWRTPVGLEKVQNFYKVHVTPFSFTDWMVFAVKWSDDHITWYVNNTEIYTMQMTEQPMGCTSGDPDGFSRPDGPFCIRFNSGPNTIGDHTPVLPETLPAYLEVEYVRMYKPEGEKAAPITYFSGTRNQICSTEISFESSNTILTANYYPDADYSWSSPAFDIEPFEMPGYQPQHHSGKVKIWIKPFVQGDRSYPVIVSTNLLSHSEQDTAWYYICTDVPPIPPDQFQASRIEGPMCLYEISHPIQNPTTAVCEFFNEAAQSWQEAPIRTIDDIRYAFYGRYDPQDYVPVQYREKNACGYSEIRHSGLTIPVPPPGTCGW